MDVIDGNYTVHNSLRHSSLIANQQTITNLPLSFTLTPYYLYSDR